MKALCNLPSDVVVEVSYYDNNNFGINGFKQLLNFEQVSCYHSGFLFHKEIYAFEITLTPISMTQAKLVEYLEHVCCHMA